jgi:uncharacterized protein with HEPN domain
MSRDWRIYVEDIVACCDRITKYTPGMSKDAFLCDNKTYDAVVRNLEIIGEAAKHVPDDVRALMPLIDWRGAAGLRDMLAHAYFGIDDDIVWDVIINKIPELREKLSAIS